MRKRERREREKGKEGHLAMVKTLGMRVLGDVRENMLRRDALHVGINHHLPRDEADNKIREAIEKFGEVGEDGDVQQRCGVAVPSTQAACRRESEWTSQR